DDRHDLLARGQAVEDLGTDRPLAHARDEVLDDLEVDVGLEEGEADLAHRGVDVGLGHATAAGQPGEGLAEAIAEAVEHAETGILCRWSRAGRLAPAGWCAGSGDTEADGVYAMASDAAPGPKVGADRRVR